MSSRFRPACLSGLFDAATQTLRALVERKFQLDNLQMWQTHAVEALLKGNDVVVKAGTGMGKSVVFQAMALSRPEAIVLVVCPLISLMEDQVFFIGVVFLTPGQRSNGTGDPIGSNSQSKHGC
jgi:superfamily II DNA or RNA helicase